jgi:hypothetical protein
MSWKLLGVGEERQMWEALNQAELSKQDVATLGFVKKSFENPNVDVRCFPSILK